VKGVSQKQLKDRPGMSIDRCPNCAFNLRQVGSLVYGNVMIDEKGEILYGGQIVPLSKGLHKIAEALIRARGRRLSRGFLVEALDVDVYDLTITKYIQRLRDIFRTIDPSFDQIVSARGFGAYQWQYRPAGTKPRSASTPRGPLDILNSAAAHREHWQLPAEWRPDGELPSGPARRRPHPRYRGRQRGRAEVSGEG
jgi:hypothetical protein